MKTLLLLCSLLSTSWLVPGGNDQPSDAIIGYWLNASGKGQIQIYKNGNAYFGKLYWLKEPNNEKGTPKLDGNNPDASQKNKPLLGLVLLRNFQYDAGEWNGGRIYDPQNGKDYKCILKLKDANTLSVRGYIGISMFGRTEIWTRVKALP